LIQWDWLLMMMQSDYSTDDTIDTCYNYWWCYSDWCSDDDTGNAVPCHYCLMMTDASDILPVLLIPVTIPYYCYCIYSDTSTVPLWHCGIDDIRISNINNDDTNILMAIQPMTNTILLMAGNTILLLQYSNDMMSTKCNDTIPVIKYSIIIYYYYCVCVCVLLLCVCVCVCNAVMKLLLQCYCVILSVSIINVCVANVCNTMSINAMIPMTKWPYNVCV